MSHISKSGPYGEHARYSSNIEQPPSVITARIQRFHDHDFRTPAVPARSSSFRNEKLQLPQRKLPRFSPSTSSEFGKYRLSNILQSHLSPSTSHPTTFRNLEETTVIPDFFEIFLDVHEYKPNELKVKLRDGFVIIVGEHEERMDNVSLISQQFTRKYEIPEDLDKGKINCFISSDGILCILCPKNSNKMDRDIPIIPVVVDKPAKMKSPMKRTALEKQSVQSVKNQSIIEQPSPVLIKTQEMQESVSQQSEVVQEAMEQEVVPEAMEQEHVPENKEQKNVPQPNKN
ncbi:unnamed protein product [Nezara viridula]|nr:unnamed protein product [Nezara viridula]